MADGVRSDAGDGDAPELTVAIASFNGAHHLRRLLPSVVPAARTIPMEVVVVDDCSSDDSVGVAQAHGARVVRHPVNRGVSAVRNTAAAHARGPWILFIDEDVTLDAGDIQALWTCRREGVCIVPAVVGRDGRLQNAVTATWRWGNLKFVIHPEPVRFVAFPMGACFLVTRSEYLRSGGSEERIRFYFDDVALGWRLREAGTEIEMVPDVQVVHDTHGGDASPERQRSNDRWLWRNRWVFVRSCTRGRRRALALVVGVARVLVESMQVRSFGPCVGYVRGVFVTTARAGNDSTSTPLRGAP